MAAISAKDVSELRKQTGAGMMDCKKALASSDGDYDGALEYLRKKGQKVVAKRAGKDASEGVVVAMTNDSGDKGILMSVSCETDFAAKNEMFLAAVKEISELAMAEMPATTEDLLALTIGEETVAAKLEGMTAITGEKTEISNYHVVSGEKIQTYIHAGSKIGVVVSYKDGGKGEEAAKFFRNVAMHIAAMNPSGMTPDEFDADFVAKETEALQAQIKAENEAIEAENPGLPEANRKPLKKVPQYVSKLQLTPEVMAAAEEAIKAELQAEGKPEKIWDKILPGKLERFVADNTQLDQERCLLSQFFALDDTKTVAQAVADFADGAELVEFKRASVG
jgi:elongation factor Ts